MRACRRAPRPPRRAAKSRLGCMHGSVAPAGGLGCHDYEIQEFAEFWVREGCKVPCAGVLRWAAESKCGRAPPGLIPQNMLQGAQGALKRVAGLHLSRRAMECSAKPLYLKTWCGALDCAQGVLNWVAEPEPGRAPPPLEARLYGPLFRSQTPGDLGDEWVADLNPESLTTVAGALAGPALVGAKAGDWHAPPSPPLPFCLSHVCF